MCFLHGLKHEGKRVLGVEVVALLVHGSDRDEWFLWRGRACGYTWFKVLIW